MLYTFMKCGVRTPRSDARAELREKWGGSLTMKELFACSWDTVEDTELDGLCPGGPSEIIAD
jgi:hypothetical protein